jgi:hypothetical protein
MKVRDNTSGVIIFIYFNESMIIKISLVETMYKLRLIQSSLFSPATSEFCLCVSFFSK